jgi:pSer/pThr/pTyr-binding forkhead associated (FHA) protein
VLPANSVSREHARIVPSGGQYFVEDLQSRNKTYVNNKVVEGRYPTPLKNGDNIKICDFLFSFHDENAKGPFPTKKANRDDEEEETSNTTVEASGDPRHQHGAQQDAERASAASANRG